VKVVSVASMRALDERTIAAGTTGHVLMERAGRQVFLALHEFIATRLGPRHAQRIVVLAGKGNNGGDAYVVARLLAEASRTAVTVCAVCPVGELKGDARRHAEALPASVPVVVCDELPAAARSPGTVLVDGLLGTGFSGPLRAPYDRWIRSVNDSGLPVVAIDIPSGLNGETGETQPEAVVADLTVTLAQPKAGLITENGLAHCGVMRCADIGIPPAFVERTAGCGEALFAADAAALLRRRPHASHKGTFGTVLVAGGSSLYVGAPFLAGAAALRSGAGLVTVAVPARARQAAQPPLAALIVRAMPDADTGLFGVACAESLRVLLGDARAAVFGPGIGSCPEGETVLRMLLTSDRPLVLDADGLRLLARHPDCAPATAPLVLTPHPGEMRALLTGFGLERLLAARRTEQAMALAQRTRAFVVLKGLGTVIAAPDGRVAVNTSGTSGLATAGSGDVLAGLLGGLLAQGMAPWEALCLGVFVHGLAAELAPTGNRALVADDLLPLIGHAFRELSPFA